MAGDVVNADPAGPLTVAAARRVGRKQLNDADVAEADQWVDWLLTSVLRLSRCELAVAATTPLSAIQRERFFAHLGRAVRHEPPQYIVGEAEFMGWPLYCDARALIPRPETEQGVAMMVADTRWQQRAGPVAADIGTGTGAIAIALAQLYPAASYWAVEMSPDALELATANVKRHGVTDRIRLLPGHGTHPLADDAVDLIAANLPYLTTAEWEALPRHIREYEPRQALDGGADGLDVIRVVVADTPRVLRSGGCCYLEIGARQGRAVAKLLEQAGFQDIAIRPDWSQRDRYVCGRWPLSRV